MANSSVIRVPITANLDAAAIEAAINDAISTQEALGFDLDKAVEFEAVQGSGGALSLDALLTFVPGAGTLGSLVKLLIPVALADLQTDYQAMVDANEDDGLGRFLVGHAPVAIGRGPGCTFALLLTFGFNPATAGPAVGAATADNNKLVSGAVLTESGGSGIAAYNFDVTIAVLIISALTRNIAAVAASELLANGDSLKLDGAAPVALTADGQTLYLTLVALVNSATPKFAYIFGAEAADTAEVLPSKTQLADALVAKFGANWDDQVAVICDVVKIQRVAVDTITVTASAALTGAVKDLLVQYQNTSQGIITASDVT